MSTRKRINHAIVVLERVRDGTSTGDEVVFTGRIGDEIREIGDEFMLAVSGLVGATMETLEGISVEDAPLVFRQRLETLLQRMMSSELH